MSKLIKWEKSGLKSPLSRAKGLGSAKSGTHHWMMERITSVTTLILGIWFLYSVLFNPDLQYLAGAETWISNPINAVGMILFVISTFYHAALGCQVIIEDYVHHEGFKLIKLYGQRLILLTMAVACIFSILQVAL